MTILIIFLITSIKIIVQRSAQPKSMKKGLLSTRQDSVTEVPVLGFNQGFTKIFRALWQLPSQSQSVFIGDGAIFHRKKLRYFLRFLCVLMCTSTV